MSASTLAFCSLLITPFLPSKCYITTHKTVRLHVLQQSVFVALPHFLTAVSSLITLPKSFQATDFSCWLLISPLDRVQRESISIHVLITHFTKIHFNIILSSTHRSLAVFLRHRLQLLVAHLSIGPYPEGVYLHSCLNYPFYKNPFQYYPILYAQVSRSLSMPQTSVAGCSSLHWTLSRESLSPFMS
jgi:hypothetical protein